MEIIRFGGKGDRGQMVRVSVDEALRLIASLAQQIAERNPNSSREEFRTGTGEYFSVAVHGRPAGEESER